MAQDRGKQRGVTTMVAGAFLLLFGMVAFAAGCSSVDGSEAEPVATTSEAQTKGCVCPPDNPCATFTCNLLTNTCTAKVAIAEGDACADKALGVRGVCHLNLCCNGCVVAPKGGVPSCAPRDGTETTQCGVSGVTCKNCTGDACNVGACVSRSCTTNPVAEGDACVNTTGACHNGSCCKGCLDKNGDCQPGGALNACGASDSKLVDCQDCTDADACTAEACVSGSCQYPAAPPGSSCGDGDICNGDEACSGTDCKAGTPLNCDDGEICTKDSCGANGCIHTALTGNDCSDGDPCTTGDKCGNDGTCHQGAPINCDDGQFCTSDSCSNGKCVNQPKTDGTGCDDLDQCTNNDKCASGKCKGSGSNVDCDDGNICTQDSLVSCAGTACNHVAAPATTSCIPDKCHAAGHCSGQDGTCVPGPAINCDDGNPCTRDSCDPAKGCQNVNDASLDCSDGDPCTENDVCVKGSCGGKPKTCLALDACHDAGTCNPNNGKCDDPRADDGKACPGGTCENGTCILDPNAGLGGEGAGGAASAAGGVGAEGGQPLIVVAGAGPTTGEAGQGESPQPSEAGAGTVEEPERPFVRNPGGCSCELPGRGGSERPVLALGLAVVAGAALRRARKGRTAA